MDLYPPAEATRLHRISSTVRAQRQSRYGHRQRLTYRGRPHDVVTDRLVTSHGHLLIVQCDINMVTGEALADWQTTASFACQHCHAQIVRNRPWQRYCSNACRVAGYWARQK